MLAYSYDYPILGIFWTIFIIFIWVAWIVLLFRVFADIFRDHDLGGWGKALWSIFVLLVPFLGVFVYLIARGHGMSERDIAQAREQQAAFESYVQDVAGGDGTADQLTKLAQLRDSGALSDAEFEAQKAKLLS